MKKIGIMTFWWVEKNYGQLLQGYALSKYLEHLGYEVELIRYRYKPNSFVKYKHKLNILKKKTIKEIFLYIFKMAKGFYFKEIMNKHEEDLLSFIQFQEKNLTFSDSQYSSIAELRESPPKYNYYLCGSDQVWNYFLPGEKGFDKIDAFSLDFGSSTINRISYAASMGFSGIEETHLDRLTRNLKNFDAISVRERNAQEILESRGLHNVVWVPDPTLLLGADGYLSFIIDDKAYKKDFFIYGLKNKSILKMEVVIDEVVNQKQVFDYATGEGVLDRRISCFPSVEQWINHIYHAKTVITNSFHGCVFSVLFHKNFYYVPLLPNERGDVDSRIDSLLTKLGIEGRAITTKQQLSSIIANPHKQIDWDSVDERRKEFVQVGKDFLAKHLGEDIQ